MRDAPDSLPPPFSPKKKVTNLLKCYINRSVMIMEPMAGATADNREKEERGKFRAGLKRGSGSLKRKREDEDVKEESNVQEDMPKRKKAVNGPKGPNPLAVKKPKKKPEGPATTFTEAESKDLKTKVLKLEQADGSEPILASIKGKRKRKHKSGDSGRAAPVKPEMADEDG
jgi:U3 small nucleolar RNA-associated protein 23